jgi:hypothetical protein
MRARTAVLSFQNVGGYFLASASVFALAALLGNHQLQVDRLSRLIRQSVESRALPMSGNRLLSLPARSVVASPQRRPFSATVNHFLPEELGPSRRIDLAPPGPNEARTLAHANMPPKPPAQLTSRLAPDTPLPVLFAPDLPTVSAPDDVPVPPSQADDILTPVQRAAVTARLNDGLGAALAENFSLFLYVSKAPNGPLAQRLYIFEKNAKGELVLSHDWAASTGRERYEISPAGRHAHTVTPAGYYELDPDRMYIHYHSASWDQPMPYAMFFNWVNHGLATGLAIHAASGGDIAKLGERASAGCVHLSPEHARQLYDLIRDKYRGAVPRFAYDGQTQTMSNKGALMRGQDGNIKMAEGYRVLVVIENFAGRRMVAARD